MRFSEWWATYRLPVISSRGTFDLLQKATQSAFNAGKRAGRKEATEKWLKRQSSLFASSGQKRSTGG